MDINMHTKQINTNEKGDVKNGKYTEKASNGINKRVSKCYEAKDRIEVPEEQGLGNRFICGSDVLNKRI